MLVLKADKRKDWEDKAMVGYFIGYSKSNVEYCVLLCDALVTSVHVICEAKPTLPTCKLMIYLQQ